MGAPEIPFANAGRSVQGAFRPTCMYMWLSRCRWLVDLATRALPLLAIALLALLRVSAQTTVSVTGLNNIYGSGFGTAPAPGGGTGGDLPIQYDLPAGVTALTFTNVAGGLTFDVNSWPANPADGGTTYNATTNVASYNSLSGIIFSGRTAFLVGVFLDATTPTGPAPATLSYDLTSAGLPSFSPLLRQVFFIGDGLDASLATQVFDVPAGAVRLFLGVADAYDFTSIIGLPGWYGGNGGTLTVTINAIPEPATLSLLFGLSVFAAAGWRIHSNLKIRFRVTNRHLS